MCVCLAPVLEGWQRHLFSQFLLQNLPREYRMLLLPHTGEQIITFPPLFNDLAKFIAKLFARKMNCQSPFYRTMGFEAQWNGKPG